MPSTSRDDLQSARFEDPENARTTSVLRRILLTVGVAVVLQVITSPLLGGAAILGAAFSGVVLATAVVGLLQLRRGRTRAAVIEVCVVAWLMVTGAVLIFGGDVGASGLFYLVVLLLVGLMWSEPAVLAFCAASIVAALGATLLVEAGQLPRLGPDGSPAAGWYALTVALCVTAALLNLVLGSIREALVASRRSERKFAELVEASPDGILSLDADGRVGSANPAAERIFGRPAGELLGASLLDTGTFEAAGARGLAPALASVRRGDIPGSLELDVIREDLGRVPVELTLRPLEPRDGGSGVQLTLRDQSERKLAMQEQRRLEEQLRHAQKMEAIGQLAGGVAHDFNNYLTIVLTNCELLLCDPSDRDQLASGVAEITQAAEQAAAVTRQLLVFSRKQEFHPQVVDPWTLVRSMRRLLQRAVGEQVEMELRQDGDVGRVFVDPAQLDVAILNLAVNARDAMPGGGKLFVTVSNAELTAGDVAGLRLKAPPGSYAMISVSDQGEGIDARIRDRIFEPFFTTKEEGRGTGLGLATVYGVVQKSGGALGLESAAGTTTFRIYLPLYDEAATTVVAAEPHERLARGSETVLLVEDDDGVRKMVLGLLQAHGYQVLEAADGKDALTLGQEHRGRIDLLLTDVILPRLGGLDLAEALDASRPGLSTLFMSGYSDRAYTEHDAPGRRIAFISKPFTARQLLHKVRGQIDGSRAAH